MSMMPNTSVRPAASRNSIRPNCTPFRVCSRKRVAVMQTKKGGASAPPFEDLHWKCLFHLAVFGPEVDVLGEHGADLLVDDAALLVLDQRAHVVVLDRRAVVGRLPVAARGLDSPGRAHQ